MIKAVIFDCYGVIRPDILPRAYRHFGGDPERDQSFIADTIAAVNRGLLPNSRSVFAEHFGITPEAWMEVFEHGVKNNQTLLDFVQSLRAQYKTGLLSNIGKGRLQEIFAPGELERYFDVAVASGDIGHLKARTGGVSKRG